MSAVQRLVRVEEYDSDAIVDDMEINYNSNIAHILNDDKKFEAMQRYMKYSKLHKASFSTGFSFFYWKQYEFPSKTQMVNEWSWNVNDHSGYTSDQLYIAQKYKNIKEEVLNNIIYPFECVKYESVVFKAAEYIQKMFVKQTKADVSIMDVLYCGIRTGRPLLMENLIAIILYTDHSELSKEFSSTFRRLEAHEKLESIKNRNREFWNWSKILRETVEYFGCDRWNNGDNDGMKGPFFCGLSFEMVIPQFNIRLNGPTSTSVQIEVAARFGGDRGIIMYLNNMGDESSKWLRCFDCSLISCYKEEDERLFMGGAFAMAIESIRIKRTNETFAEFFQPLYYFDCMINGTAMDSSRPPNIRKKHYNILSKLIKNKIGIINDENNYIFHEYITSTFDIFCSTKNRVIINLYHMNTWFSELRNLILFSLPSQKKNLFSETILKLFPNLNTIIIYSPASNYYSFDLRDLLKLISTSEFVSNNLKILIKSKS
eukprot:508044_1